MCSFGKFSCFFFFCLSLIPSSPCFYLFKMLVVVSYYFSGEFFMVFFIVENFLPNSLPCSSFTPFFGRFWFYSVCSCPCGILSKIRIQSLTSSSHSLHLLRHLHLTHLLLLLQQITHQLLRLQIILFFYLVGLHRPLQRILHQSIIFVLGQKSLQTHSSLLPLSFPVCHGDSVHAYPVGVYLGGFWKVGVYASLFVARSLKAHHLSVWSLSQFSSFRFDRHLLRHHASVGGIHGLIGILTPRVVVEVAPCLLVYGLTCEGLLSWLESVLGKV